MGQGLGAGHDKALEAKAELANFLADQGESSEARQLYEECAAMYEAQKGADHLDTLAHKICLSDVLNSLGERTEAIQLLEVVVAAVDLGPDPPPFPLMLAKGNLSEVMADEAKANGDCTRAAELYQAAADVFESVY